MVPQSIPGGSVPAGFEGSSIQDRVATWESKGFTASQLGFGLNNFGRMSNHSGSSSLIFGAQGGVESDVLNWYGCNYLVTNNVGTLKFFAPSRFWYIQGPNGGTAVNQRNVSIAAGTNFYMHFMTPDGFQGTSIPNELVQLARADGIGGIMIFAMGYDGDNSVPVNQRNPIIRSFASDIGGVITPPPPAPAIPTLIAPSAGAVSVPILGSAFTWTTDGIAASWHIQISNTAVFQPGTMVADANTSSPTYIPGVSGNPSLVNNTIYYWHVNAVGNGQQSPYSVTGSFTTIALVQAKPPSKPTLISPADNAVSQPLTEVFTWTTPITDTIRIYYFQLATDAGFTSLTRFDSIGVAPGWTVPNLTQNTVYYWRVKALNSAGDSGFSVSRTLTTVGGQPPFSQGYSFITRFNPATKGGQFTSDLPPYEVGTLNTNTSTWLTPPAGTYYFYGVGLSLPDGSKPLFGSSSLTSSQIISTLSSSGDLGTTSSPARAKIPQTGTNGLLDQSFYPTMIRSDAIGTFQFPMSFNVPPLFNANGVSPFTVTSRTIVLNLNAQFLAGYAPSLIGAPSTIPVTGANGKIDTSFYNSGSGATAPYHWFDDELVAIRNTDQLPSPQSTANANSNVVNAMTPTFSCLSSFYFNSAPNTAHNGQMLVENTTLSAVDSGEVGILTVAVTADTVLANRATINRGAWICDFGGNGSAPAPSFPMMAVGDTFFIRLFMPANMDSSKMYAGMTAATATARAFPVAESLKAGWRIEFGPGRSTTVPDSVYLITCDGTTNTKLGICPYTASQYVALKIAPGRSSLTVLARSQANSYATLYSRTSTTNLPAANLGGIRFMGLTDYGNLAKAYRFARFGIKIVENVVNTGF
jgi:hypothetical protein